MASRPPRSCPILIAFLLCPAAAQEPPPMPIPTVRVTSVVAAEVRERQLVTGSLRAVSRAAVAATEPGRIVAVQVNPADIVAAGDVLARVDARRLQLDLDRVEAELAVAKGEIDIRRLEAKTAADDLASYRAAAEGVSGSVSALSLRAAVRDEAVARARVLLAESGLAQLHARVDRLKLQLEDTVVRAPFAGRIMSRDVEPGEWVSEGGTICTLVSTGPIEAWLEIPEQVPHAAVAASSDLEIRVDSLDLRLTPTRVRVLPDVDLRARRYMVIADLDPGEHALAPGMSITARIPVGGRVARLRVPTDAVLRDAAGSYVYKVLQQPTGGAVVMQVPVQAAFAQGPYLYLSAPGLSAGDQIVVEGNERLRPMAPVQVAAAPVAPAKAEEIR